MLISTKQFNRNQHLTKLKIDDNYVTVPFLDRRNTKLFIDAILLYYNIESLELYKSSNMTNLKAAFQILIENKANQNIINELMSRCINY